MAAAKALAWALAAALVAPAAPGAAEAELARQVLEATGTRGGLVVHLGCGEGKLTAALCAGDGFVVCGLDADAGNVDKARAYVRSKGLYGRVSIDRQTPGRLPYADEMANLVVGERLNGVSMDEIMRVLCPGGVAYMRGEEGAWTKTLKPRPADIDEWTHWLHDAGNNAVAHDARVGPPRRMKWVAEPLWSRGHEVPTSVGGVVTAEGRIFYTLDEGQTGIYDMPSRWTLIARDAFNGVELWKRPVPHWGPALAAGGFGNGFRPRRLVTDGRRVYLPTGERAVLTAVDAATGKTVKTLDELGGTSDILCADGLLVVLSAPRADDERKGQPRPAAALLGLKAETLEVFWRVPAGGVAASTIALGAGRVVYRAKADVVALDARSGKESWRTAFAEPPKPQPTTAKAQQRRAGLALILHERTVYVQAGARLGAFSAQSGKLLWEQKSPASSKNELFAAGGLLWQTRGEMFARDLATGELRRTVDPSAVWSKGHHPRCYPNKATDQYLITNNRGAEFVSMTTDQHVGNDWVRGNCAHGVMPANGLLYAPPNQCFCYGGAILTGFKALAAAPPEAEPFPPATDRSRLQAGPAYDDVSRQPAAMPKPADGDWPMYRRDAGRHGSTATRVGAGVRPLWRAAVGGRLTAPVVADGMLLAASIDEYTIHALSASDGRKLWTFTAGGRIDSAPTFHDGLVLFGCADGWVYCLRASDGAEAWRFLAAPVDRRIGAFGRVESVWPVHGSVVVLNDLAYVVAGRSTHLDGGLYAYALQPRTGQVVHHAVLSGLAGGPEPPAPNSKDPYLPAFHVEGTRSDLLVAEGGFLYLGALKLDAKLLRQPTPYVEPGEAKTTGLDLTQAPYVDTRIFQAGLEKRRQTDFPSLGVLRGPMGDKAMGPRMVATGGFLDDSGFNRTYWMYSSVWPGYYIAHLGAKCGQLLVADSHTTYGVQAFPSRTIHSATFHPGTKGYLLFADDNAGEPVLDARTRNRDKGMGYSRLAPPRWFQWVPIRVRAMVAAEGLLFVAGPPDLAEESDPYAAFEDRKGGLLWAFQAGTGVKAGECKLDSGPVFDGMIAAGGRLFVSTRAGQVVCLGSGHQAP